MAKKNTIILSRDELKQFFIDSVKAFSDKTFYRKGTSTYSLSLDDRNFTSIFKNIHSTGKGRSVEDECRIQVSQNNFLEIDKNEYTGIYLGYFYETNTISAWDPNIQNQRLDRGTQNISLYNRFSKLELARSKNASIYKDTDEQIILNFKPEHLGFYLSNFEILHQISDEDKIIEIFNNYKVTSLDTDSIEVKTKHNKREKVKTRTYQNPRRNAQFRTNVMETYKNRCAMSGIQLTIVEAAHIVPLAHEKGDNSIDNGICLSSIHHSAYDRGIIYFDEEFRILVNKSKLNYMEKLGIDGGFAKFRDLNYDFISLPEIKDHYPSKEKIKLANSIRGII